MNKKIAKEIKTKFTMDDLTYIITSTFGKLNPAETKFIFEDFPNLIFEASPIYQKFLNKKCTSMESTLHLRVTDFNFTKLIASFLIVFSADIEKNNGDYELTNFHYVMFGPSNEQVDSIAAYVYFDSSQKGLRYLFDYDISL